MKAIAALSRSHDIDYNNLDWHKQNDSITQADIDEIQFFIDQNAKIGGEVHFVIRKSKNKGYDVLLAAITNRQDHTSTKIRAFIVYFGREENVARQLALVALEKPDALRRDMEAAFSEELDDSINKRRWKVDFVAAEEILKKDYIQEMAIDEKGRPFSNAWEIDNTIDARKDLIEEIQEFRFSSGPGVKVIVTAQPSTEYWEKAQLEADRFLWRGADKTDLIELRKKKGLPPRQPEPTQNPPDTPKTTSGGQSKPSLPQPSSTNSKSPSSETSSIPLPIPSPNGLQRWLSSNWKWALPLAGVVVIGAGVAGVVLIKKIINKPEVTRFSPSAEKNDNKIEPTPPQEPAKTEKKQ